MMKKKYNIFKGVRIFLVLLFLVGTAAIALYEFDNRNLELRIITDSGTYVQENTNVQIAQGKCNEYLLEQVSSVKIKKIRIYGELKSMLIKEIGYGELASYISAVENGELQWAEDGIVLTGNGEILLRMNESYIAMLQKESATFLQERFILIGIYFVLIALGMLVCGAVEEKLTADNWNNHGPVFETKKFFKDIQKYGQYMVYAANADLRAEVADSYLNRLWWLLEPFFNMIVYVIVFGNVMGNSVENYATFVFSAFLMWNFFSKTINYSVKLVRNNKEIVTKVYIPKFILLLSNMILNMLKLLFSMIVLVAMMIIFHIEIGWNFLWVIPAYAVMVLLAFGTGMIFLHFGVYVDDLFYAVGILLNMLMFLSGIFYDVMTTLPEPLNTIVMCLNPVAIFTDTMRNALLYNTAANLPMLGVWLLLSVILCCIGVHIVYKNENSYVKVV